MLLSARLKNSQFGFQSLALQGLPPQPWQAAHIFSISDSHLEMEKTNVSLSWEYFETKVTGNLKTLCYAYTNDQSDNLTWLFGLANVSFEG